jgi:hypothetical protein
MNRMDIVSIWYASIVNLRTIDMQNSLNITIKKMINDNENNYKYGRITYFVYLKQKQYIKKYTNSVKVFCK